MTEEVEACPQERREEMSDNNSMIDLSGLTKPGTVLIERLSDAVGGMFRPWQIERVAKAEAKADKIRAAADLDIEAMQSAARAERAFRRLVSEETQKQENIERIGGQGALYLNEDATPEDMEEDWIFNFLDKCRLTSDEEMQEMWARILAGEANQPGSYSKRTVNLMASIDKRDARMFTDLCRFAVQFKEGIGRRIIYRDGSHSFPDNVVPFIFDADDDIYFEGGVTSGRLWHLDDIGLIQLVKYGETGRESASFSGEVEYFGTRMHLKLPTSSERKLPVGKAHFTQAGSELFEVCNPSPKEGFLDYLCQEWESRGVAVEVDESS